MLFKTDTFHIIVLDGIAIKKTNKSATSLKYVNENFVARYKNLDGSVYGYGFQ